jgi:hypothetical protein
MAQKLDTLTVWNFETARFTIALEIDYLDYFTYDGDDEGGEIQANLRKGDYVAFDSQVVVYLDGQEIGFASLGGSIYARNEVSDFWTAHRDPDPMNRNCSTMRAARGENCSVGHYFPDMIREAVAGAREALGARPAIRANAA